MAVTTLLPEEPTIITLGAATLLWRRCELWPTIALYPCSGDKWFLQRWRREVQLLLVVFLFVIWSYRVPTSVPCAIIYFMALTFLKFFLFAQVYRNIYIKLSTKSDVATRAVIILHTQGTTKCLMTVSQYLGRWHGWRWFADTGSSTQMFAFTTSANQSHLVRILYIIYKTN